MRRKYTATQWRDRFLQCKTVEERERITGLPINLAAEVLGITRSRVQQLLKEDKLDCLYVHDDDTGRQIGLLVTLSSINRRRTLKRRPGQWLPRRPN